MRYLLTLIGPEGGPQGEMTPDELRAAMEPWNDYNRQVLDAGVFVAGDALHPSSAATTVRLADGGDQTVTDGPFAETKEQLGGFWVVTAADLDAALALAARAATACRAPVEVRPFQGEPEG